MKLVNYQLQTQIERLSKDKPTQFFSEYIRSVIEDTNKPYYRRADYVGLSLQELKFKVDTLGEDIRELQQLKKQLSEALEIAKETIASIFIVNGIDRIDGNIISSLTLTEASTKTNTTLEILDPDAVMRLGYIKYEPDMEAIAKAMATMEGLVELDKFVSITATTVTTPSKIKVNTKRTSFNHTQADELLTLVENQEAA